MEAESRQLRDELRELVSAGDYIIRQVANGFIIRRVPYEGGRLETWLVEGELTDVAKQLTAIQATEVMNARQMLTTIETNKNDNWGTSIMASMKGESTVRSMVSDEVRKLSGTYFSAPIPKP